MVFFHCRLSRRNSSNRIFASFVRFAMSDPVIQPHMDNRRHRPIRGDIIIQGGILLSMAEGQLPLHQATVCIQGDRIIDIHEGMPDTAFPEGSHVIDATNGLIMPGLVNAHGHSAMAMFRGLADDLPLKQWLSEKIFPAEAKHLSPETVYWGALLGCVEMIASGTTTVSDGYFFQDATVRAVHKSGLRAVVAQGIIDFPAPGVPDPLENLRVGEQFIQKWLDFSGLITPGLFCHSTTTCSAKTLQGAMEISERFSLPLQIHLSETSDEVTEVLQRTGRRPAFYLDRLGLLNDHFIGIHGVHLDEEEVHLLAEKSCHVVHVPESNMKLASGDAKVSRMLNMGLRVGLGTDGCASNNNLDLFQEMGTAARLGKVFTLNPVAMDAGTVLKMATAWGAEVLGMHREIGTLEIGKKADIIVVDLEKPHLTPLYNPLSNLVYSASGADVRDVIINGKILMRDRCFQNLDVEDVMRRVRRISESIKKP
jgi:5-methylthioadenosine/S-adenosylhomocysteine deaminase